MQKTRRVLATAYVVHISTFSYVSYRATTRNRKQASFFLTHLQERKVQLPVQPAHSGPEMLGAGGLRRAARPQAAGAVCQVGRQRRTPEFVPSPSTFMIAPSFLVRCIFLFF